jgi:hypothetical protein
VSLWFGEHLDPARLRTFLAARRRAHGERLARYRDALDAVARGDRYRAAVVQFGIRYEEAVLAWLDDVAADAPARPRRAARRS